MKKRYDLFRIIFSVLITITLLVLELTIGDINLGINTFKNLVILPIALITYIFISYDLYIKAIKDVKKKKFFTEITLSIIATIAAFAIQEYVEGLAVIVFFQLGSAFEEFAINKSRKSIKAIMNLRPDSVTKYIDNKEIIVDPYSINLDDIIIVKPGERVPLDGIIIKGSSSLDTSSITGESIPVDVKENEEIISGVINLSSPLLIKVQKLFYESTINKILDLVENATNNKTEPEKFITKFSKIYTPTVIILAFLVSIIPPLFLGINKFDIWSSWIQTGASFLVISCPCSLVLSVPMAYFVGIGVASKNKAIIKGSAYLELLSKIKTLVLDKTGTITKGNFIVTDLVPVSSSSNEELLLLARNGEYYSNHPIAKAILDDQKDEINEKNLNSYQVIEGKGIKVMYNNKLLYVGKGNLLDAANIKYFKNDSVGTIIYVAYDNVFKGSIVIRDTLKPNTNKSINNLYKSGIKNIYMLTGDNEKVANSIAKEAHINNFYSDLLPLDKTKILEDIIKKDHYVAFAGDGVNDAPSISLASIGISMGQIGSDAAIEASDIIIMNDNLNSIAIAKNISKRTIRIVYQNIVFSLFIKFSIMILALVNSFIPFGITPLIMWLAIFADVGVTIICVLNSMRLMFKKKF